MGAGFLCKYTKTENLRYTFSIFETLMKYTSVLLFLLIALSCTSDDDIRRNPFLIDIAFQRSLNVDLPQFSPLDFPNNSVIIPGEGIRGVVIYHAGNNQYFAYELSDPNHAPNSCSGMQVNAITATCPCPDDTNSYNIVTGQHSTNPELFPMKAYRVQREGNIVRVFN